MNDQPRRRTLLAWVVALPSLLIVALFRFYQRFISRYTPPSCRFFPVCSRYGVVAVQRHGAMKGLVLTSWRVLRCNPFNPGGVDRVPPEGEWRAPPYIPPDERPAPSV